MQLSAVVLARVIGYIDAFDLNPRGTLFFPTLVKSIVERYHFQKFPKAEEYDGTKGIEFQIGELDRVSIAKFTVFNTLLVVETRSSTTDSMRVLEDMLVWGAATFGLNYTPGMIRRYAYVSDLTFHSSAPLLDVYAPIKKLAVETGKIVSGIWQDAVVYEGQGFAVGHDPLLRKYGIAPFSIARRVDTKFSEGKYFSEAPLPTDDHMRLLEQYERDVLALVGGS